MSDMNDFIMEVHPYNGPILKQYIGKSKEVTIPDGIQYIGSGAFTKNKTVRKVVLSDSVQWIGWNAFAGCTKLREVILTNNTVSVGKDAFLNTALEELVAPAVISFEPVFGDNKKREVIVPLAYPLVSLSKVSNKTYKICLTLGYLRHKELYAPRVAASYEKYYQEYAEVVLEAARRYNIVVEGLTDTAPETEGEEDFVAPYVLSIKEAQEKKFSFDMKPYGYRITHYSGEEKVVDIPDRIARTDVMGVYSHAFPYRTVLRCSGKLFARLTPVNQIPAVLAYLAQTVEFSAAQKKAMDECMKTRLFRFYECAVEYSDVATLHVLMEKLPHPFTVAEIDSLLQKSTASVEITTILLERKNALFSSVDAIDQELAEWEQELSMDSWTAHEWSKYIHAVRKKEYPGGYAIEYAVKKHTRIVIPAAIEGVPVIAIVRNAIADNRNIKEVVIGASVQTVESSAFSYCRNLEKVFVLSADTVFQLGAFMECPHVTIYAPEGSDAERYAKRKNFPFVAI